MEIITHPRRHSKQQLSDLEFMQRLRAATSGDWLGIVCRNGKIIILTVEIKEQLHD